jgi:hypothetical protein
MLNWRTPDQILCVSFDMTLTYGKSSPKDLLAKAQRDLKRLEGTEAAEEIEGMSDALFDLAVGLTSLKDWLKKHPSATLTATDVEHYWQASLALSSFRDLANAGKHRIITNYTPTTTDTLTSAPNVPFTFLETVAKALGRGNRYPRVKIIRVDGTRHRAVDLGRAGIDECQALMTRYGVA